MAVPTQSSPEAEPQIAAGDEVPGTAVRPTTAIGSIRSAYHFLLTRDTDLGDKLLNVDLRADLLQDLDTTPLREYAMSLREIGLETDAKQMEDTLNHFVKTVVDRKSQIEND